MLSLGSFSCRRFSSDNHIARQTPLITRFAFFNLVLILMTGSRIMSHQCPLDSFALHSLDSCTNTGSWSEYSITTLCPSVSTNGNIVSTRHSLNAFVGTKCQHLREGMAIHDPPLVRDPRSQTQFLARLHLFLDVAPSNVVCPPFGPQCTIDTSFDEAHVLKLYAVFVFPCGNLDTHVGSYPSPSSGAPQRDLGFRTKRVSWPVPLVQPLLLSSD